ncbi:acetyl-CoA C-acetyltransferase [Paenibacillus sp. VMFN-D1]|uniref:acetyl-CoA C-acetyltransferase n=1 Tax=Paenibacillus sp. VMFN-D1 TaxID=2135608 RepID=UPI000E21DCE8|nr:acetyl-CoA C-acetyltransferase [Paenibacillus sp. VMFN-D1]RED41833.1 acetyl-CoA C-acetyltransferase [Paenibacillus sp. VMFN-D1]
MNKEAVIVSAARTPIGSFNGSFKDISAVRLGEQAIRAALERAGLDPSQVDEVIMGNALQAGLGQNPARQVSLAVGIPQEASAVTVNQVCGSGLKAVQLAVQSIVCGHSEIVAAGGMENMSQAPYILKGARQGFRMGHQQAMDSMIVDGLWCATGDYHMGMTAENLCDNYSLSREQLDQFAYKSQQRAVKAVEEGRFQEEIAPIVTVDRKGNQIRIETDEYPRRDTTLEALNKLRPAFKKGGNVTAGNSSGINDGAAGLILMSSDKANELGLKPLAIVRAVETAGVDPAMMGIGPVYAIEKVFKKLGISECDIDLVELNEAFAAQTLACLRHFRFDPDRVNVNGGAIALGHPIGASGARILVTLLHEMARRRSHYGLAALCIGGGQGIAALVERT